MKMDNVDAQVSVKDLEAWLSKKLACEVKICQYPEAGETVMFGMSDDPELWDEYYVYNPLVVIVNKNIAGDARFIFDKFEFTDTEFLGWYRTKSSNDMRFKVDSVVPKDWIRDDNHLDWRFCDVDRILYRFGKDEVSDKIDHVDIDGYKDNSDDQSQYDYRVSFCFD